VCCGSAGRGCDCSLRRQVAVGPDLEETRDSQQLPIDVDDKPAGRSLVDDATAGPGFVLAMRDH
jgi:hypothetical protein